VKLLVLYLGFLMNSSPRKTTPGSFYRGLFFYNSYSRFGIFCSAAKLAFLNTKVTAVEISTMNSE
jgi:hypothetical protein